MAIVNITRTYNTGDNLTATYYNQDRQEIVAGVNSVVDAQIPLGAAIQEAKFLFNGSSGHSHAGGTAGKKVLVTSLDVTGLTALNILRVNSGGTAVEAVSPSVVAQNRAFGFFVATSPLVTGTDLSWNPTVPETMTVTKVWGYVKTAPSGGDLVAVVKKIDGTTIATLTIPSGQQNASTTTITTPNLNAGDFLKLDITTVTGSPAGLSVVVECTQ